MCVGSDWVSARGVAQDWVQGNRRFFYASYAQVHEGLPGQAGVELGLRRCRREGPLTRFVGVPIAS
ncbi:MAG: hypothetical protein AAFY31_06155 [Pseudomonadota bacterium]